MCGLTDLIITTVSGVFTLAFPVIRPVLIIGAVTDKAAKTTELVILGDDVTMG
jgi:hypothetical protein